MVLSEDGLVVLDLPVLLVKRIPVRQVPVSRLVHRVVELQSQNGYQAVDRAGTRL